jgi:hypothetical protein
MTKLIGSDTWVEISTKGHIEVGTKHKRTTNPRAGREMDENYSCRFPHDYITSARQESLC